MICCIHYQPALKSLSDALSTGTPTAFKVNLLHACTMIVNFDQSDFSIIEVDN